MVERAGRKAKLAFKAQPHMLTAMRLANKGHDTRTLQAYLRHRNIQHTVRYTELSPMRLRIFLALRAAKVSFKVNIRVGAERLKCSA